MTSSKCKKSKSSAVHSICIVCNGEFSQPAQENETNFQGLWTDLWTGFCGSFDLKPSSWTNIFSYYSKALELPFCVKCREDVASISVLYKELEAVKSRISKFTNRMSATIIKSCGSTRAKTDNQQETGNNTKKHSALKKEIKLLRKHLTNRFLPKVIIENTSFYNCSTTNKSQNDAESPNEIEIIDLDSNSNSNGENSSSDDSPQPNDAPNSKVVKNMRKPGEEVLGAGLYRDKWPIRRLGMPGVTLPDAETRHECVTCGVIQKRRSHIIAHIKREHIDGNKFSCKICGKQNRYYGTLIKHMMIHRRETGANLKGVAGKLKGGNSHWRGREKKFPGISNVTWYKDKWPIFQLNREKVQCGLCRKICTRTNVYSHIKIHHMNEKSSRVVTKTINPIPETFDCGICRTSYLRRGDLRNHLKLRHGAADQSDHDSEDEAQEEDLDCSPRESGSNKTFLYQGKWPVRRTDNAICDIEMEAHYECETCGLKLLGFKSLSIHIRHQHKTEKEGIHQGQKEVNMRSQFLYENEWPVIQVGGENGNPSSEDCQAHFSCGTCGLVRLGKASIFEHIREKHISLLDKLVAY